MRTYIIRRLLLLIPTLFIVTSMVFLLTRLIPGDIIDAMVIDMGPEAGVLDRAAIERRLGLDVPIHVQYGRWIGQILQGNLGTSLRGDEPVVEQILPRFPVTLELGVFAVIIGLLILLPIGIYSAIRQDAIADYGGRSLAIIFISVPSFWTATIVELTGGGVDYAFDAIGLRVTNEQIRRATRPGWHGAHNHGGMAILIGIPGSEMTLNPLSFMFEQKQYRGSHGACIPDQDFPMYLRWYREGKFPLNQLVTKRYQLE